MFVEKAGLVELSYTFVFQLINIGILYYFLKKYLFKPVTEFMNKRTEGIKKTIDEANAKFTEAEKYKSSYYEKLQKADEESKLIIEKAVSNANLKADGIVKDAKSEASLIKTKAEKDIADERKKAFNEIKDEISTVAILAASKVLEKEVDADKNSEIVDKFIEEVGEVKWQN